MRLRWLFFLVFFTGCVPVLDAQLRLLDVSRKGVSQVRQSLADRHQAMAALEASRRARLDAAFDRDVDDQTAITPAWVIEARRAYAAALDQFARQDQSSAAAMEADRANLAAVDAALAQLEALSRAQLKLTVLPEDRP